MNVKDELDRMDATKTIGNVIEWNDFKKKVLKNRKDLNSLKTINAHQAKRIEQLENQIKHYRNNDEKRIRNTKKESCVS